jgi:hypothetical protein
LIVQTLSKGIHSLQHCSIESRDKENLVAIAKRMKQAFIEE